MGDLGGVIRRMQGARERYSTLELDVEIRVDVNSFPGMHDADLQPLRESRAFVTIVSPTRWWFRWDGWAGPYEAGRDGWRAWSTERNHGFPSGVGGHVHSEWPIGEPQSFEQLWDPALLVSELWLEVSARRATVAGRRGLVVDGTRRPAPRPDGRDFLLLEHPAAERYELVVDEALGIVLRIRAEGSRGEMVHEEVIDARVDIPIDGSVFSRARRP